MQTNHGHCRQVVFVDRLIKHQCTEVGLEEGGHC